MTPERERLVRAVDEAAEKCYAAKWSRIIAENRSLKEARQALAAYDAAHPEEAK